MFDIGFAELLVLAVLTLLVVGPDRLPETVRTFARTLAKFRHNWNSVKRDIEKEIGMDEIRRDIHNEQILKDLKKVKQQIKTSVNDPLGGTADPAYSDPNYSNPKYDPHDYEREPIANPSATSNSIEKPNTSKSELNTAEQHRSKHGSSENIVQTPTEDSAKSDE